MSHRRPETFRIDSANPTKPDRNHRHQLEAAPISPTRTRGSRADFTPIGDRGDGRVRIRACTHYSLTSTSISAAGKGMRSPCTQKLISAHSRPIRPGLMSRLAGTPSRWTPRAFPVTCRLLTPSNSRATSPQQTPISRPPPAGPTAHRWRPKPPIGRSRTTPSKSIRIPTSTGAEAPTHTALRGRLVRRSRRRPSPPLGRNRADAGGSPKSIWYR